MARPAVSASGGAGANEDLVAVHAHGAATDILVLDGRSSVAERDHVETGIAGIAWRGTFAVHMPEGPRAGTTLALHGRTEFSFAAPTTMARDGTNTCCTIRATAFRGWSKPPRRGGAPR